jgi:hypothetical protein
LFYRALMAVEHAAKTDFSVEARLRILTAWAGHIPVFRLEHGTARALSANARRTGRAMDPAREIVVLTAGSSRRALKFRSERPCAASGVPDSQRDHETCNQSVRDEIRDNVGRVGAAGKRAPAT